YEAENGARNALKLSNLIDGAKALAHEQTDKEIVFYQNDVMLKSEIEQVIEDVKEAGIDFTREDLRTVLNSIENDKTSYRENGIRKQGIIVRKCGTKIRELVRDKAIQETGKKKSEESALNREKKDELTTVGKTIKKPEIKTASPKTTDEAMEQILKEHAGKFK
ncbi:MAG: hypothetical protein IMZ53_04925, partial [Thermoplasmata archaeon]|nr:hypothetical protein [Thermoplasmata archaeon]